MIIGYIGGISKIRFIYESVQAVCETPGYQIAFAGTTLPECDIVLCMYDPGILNNRFGMPNKLYTALKHGKPVIVSSGTDAERFVDLWRCGVSCEYSIDKFKALLSSGELDNIESITRRARIAYESCNWQVDSKKLVEVYRC